MTGTTGSSSSAPYSPAVPPPSRAPGPCRKSASVRTVPTPQYTAACTAFLIILAVRLKLRVTFFQVRDRGVLLRVVAATFFRGPSRNRGTPRRNRTGSRCQPRGDLTPGIDFASVSGVAVSCVSPTNPSLFPGRRLSGRGRGRRAFRLPSFRHIRKNPPGVNRGRNAGRGRSDSPG